VKIGLVCPYIYPENGGVAQHVRHLYENLRLRGHDVRIITASHGPQRASEGDILRIGVGFSVPLNGSMGTLTFSPRYLGQVRDLLERERFDVLHLHEPFVPFLSLFLLRESRSVNVATFHAYAGFSPSYELGSRVMKAHAARLHGRIAVSAAARHFIDRFFPGDYKVIPNGVDVPRFAGAVPLARWQDGTPNVLFVGRHEPRKGLLDLLKAHRILRKTGYEERLLVVGSGPQEREARRYVATRGLKAVEFLGRVSDAEKAQLFRTADIYASPATGGESFGIVLLEAMAAGAPIVASDIHGYKGVVRRGREGLLVPPHEPKELATATGGDERGRPRSRGGVQLAAGDRQGRGLLRLRHPAAGGQRFAAGRFPGADPSGATAPGEAVGIVRGARRRGGPLVRQREPPDPRRVGDHQAGHHQRDGQDRQHRRQQRRVDIAGHLADRELERVQVSRQDPLVSRHHGRWQRQGADVRVQDREPAHDRDDEPDDVPTRVAGGEHLERQVAERDRHEQGDRLDRDVGQHEDPAVGQLR
jgi:phosphatidylinositol alpha-mannosyltransferase